MRNRPRWTDYLLGLARVVSERSPDESTQHGCVIASPGNQVLSTGYNGPCRELLDDWTIPTSRPEKYRHMLHGEANAVLNAPGSVEGGTAYVTGRACHGCLQVLWQKGVRHVVEVDGRGWANDAEEAPLRADFLRRTGGRMKVEQVSPDLSWLVDMVLSRPELREILTKRLAEQGGELL